MTKSATVTSIQQKTQANRERGLLSSLSPLPPELEAVNADISEKQTQLESITRRYEEAQIRIDGLTAELRDLEAKELAEAEKYVLAESSNPAGMVPPAPLAEQRRLLQEPLAQETQLQVQRRGTMEHLRRTIPQLQAQQTSLVLSYKRQLLIEVKPKLQEIAKRATMDLEILCWACGLPINWNHPNEPFMTLLEPHAIRQKEVSTMAAKIEAFARGQNDD